MRASGDRLMLSPPLVVSHAEIDEIVEKAKRAIDAALRQLKLL
jgi:putrescine aminotransferase